MKEHNAMLQTQYLIHIPKATPHIHGKLNKCQLHQNSTWQSPWNRAIHFPFPQLHPDSKYRDWKDASESERNQSQRLWSCTTHKGGQRAPIRLCTISKGPLRRADVQNCIWGNKHQDITHTQKIKRRHWNISQQRRHLEIGFGNPGRTVVAPYEGITILVLQLAIHVLLSLLHCNVHITVQTSQYTWLSQEFGKKKISETNNQIQFSVSHDTAFTSAMKCYFSLPALDII